MSLRRRLPVRAVLTCLALGTALNVAVAWACALRVDPAILTIPIVDGQPRATAAELDEFRSHPIATRFSDNQLVVSVEGRHGVERRVVIPLPYWLVTTARTGSRWVGSIASTDVLDLRIRSGWPALSMEGRRRNPGENASETVSGGQPRVRLAYEWLWRMGSLEVLTGGGTRLALMPRALLPLKPLWPGFAINMLLYGRWRGSCFTRPSRCAAPFVAAATAASIAAIRAAYRPCAASAARR